MRLLVLGGGGVLGFHAATAALGRGDDVTVLSRSGSSVLDGAEVLTGDREGDLSALQGREWDAVLDTEQVREAFDHLEVIVLGGEHAAIHVDRGK